MHERRHHRHYHHPWRTFWDSCRRLFEHAGDGSEHSGEQFEDGFNLIDSSYVVVTNCNIQGSDDGMVIKSDYALGKKIGGSNIHVVNCQITSTENNALQIGSETVGRFYGHFVEEHRCQRSR